MLGTAEGSEEAIVSALNDIGIEVSKSPFDGTLSLDDLLERWGIPHHVALAAVAGLVEAEGDHIFGVPIFVLRGEPFWGHDRIPLLEERLREFGLERSD